MFMGEFEHSTDAKGRLFVPSKFRDELGEKFVVTQGADGCLWVYGMEEWNRVGENLVSTLPPNRKGRNFLRAFFSKGEEVEMDSQGRILIPAKLREYAGITKDVVSLGVDRKIEIWSKERYENLDTSYEQMDDILEELANMGIRL